MKECSSTKTIYIFKVGWLAVAILVGGNTMESREGVSVLVPDDIEYSVRP